MKHPLREKIHQIAQNPKTRQALASLKPERSIWGFLGVVVFFILPEIIAFIWGGDITAYAKEHAALTPSFMERQYYELMVMLFEEGGSWINLGIAGGLLVWLFY